MSSNRKNLILNHTIRHESSEILSFRPNASLTPPPDREAEGLGLHSPSLHLPCDQENNPTLEYGTSHSKTCLPSSTYPFWTPRAGHETNLLTWWLGPGNTNLFWVGLVSVIQAERGERLGVQAPNHGGWNGLGARSPGLCPV